MNTDKLKELLKEKNIQQQELAEAVGVSQPFISYVMRGLKDPSLTQLKRIANFLEVTVDEII